MILNKIVVGGRKKGLNLNCRSFRLRPGPADLEGVPEEFRKSKEFEARADHRGRDDVVHEEGAGIRQKDTFPSAMKKQW